MSAHVIDQLDDWVDGRLETDAVTAVRQHLEQCTTCRQAEQQLRALLQSAQALPARIEPPATVWTAVQARTVDLRLYRRQLLWSLRLPLAAAALVFLLLGSGLTVWLLRGPARPLAQPDAQAVLVAARGDYERIVNELEDALAQRSAALDTSTARIVRENLAIIDSAIAEAQAALASSPGNPTLNRLIATSYQRKIQVLERTLRLSARS